MVPYLGDFPTGQTVYIPWHTFDSNDPSASVTMTGLALADIVVFKDGSVTQRSSTSGFALLDTDGTDFDSRTGLHGISIDTSDNTDAGFFAAGSDYWVAIDSVTVDGATIRFWAAQFSIDNRGLLRPTTAQRTLDVTATGAAGIDWANVENPTTAVDLSGTDIQLCDTVTTNTDMRGTDNAALASVLGALADSAAAGDPTSADTVMQYVKQLINVLVGTSGIATFPAEASPANAVSLAEVIRAIHADVTGLNGDAMRGTDGANTTTPPTVAAIRAEMDSNSTQLAAIVADTNELQTDDVPGLIAALNDPSVADILTTQMTEAYAADGVAPTLAQAIFLIQQLLGDFAISGTTLTARRLDGSTTAATFTLDDGTNPTAITRTT